MPKVRDIVSHQKKDQGLKLYGAALKMWQSRDEEILMEGPAGTGKTRAILEKVHFCAMKYPGMRGLLVRKTRESMTESVLVTLESKVVQHGFSILEGAQRKLRQAYSYPNGSELVVGGMDKPTKIMSTEFDMICCFESTELTEEDFENLSTRLRNGMMPYQQIIADCNPGVPGHWLNKRPEKKDSVMARLKSRHEDNPFLFNHELKDWTTAGFKYLRKLDRLSGARRLRLFKGVWAAQEGMVYEEFNPEVHVIENRPLPPSWRRIRSIDFGYRNPFVCQWWAVDGDGNMYLYREIYFSGRTVADHAKAINLYSRGERYEETVSDHDAEDRATLDEVNISTSPAYKAIRPGLDAVELRIRKQANGQPRLFVMRDCTLEIDEKLRDESLPLTTEQEFEGYAYKKTAEGKANKEEPVDKDNHGMDAMRYAVAYVDNLASMSVSLSAEAPEVIPR